MSKFLSAQDVALRLIEKNGGIAYVTRKGAAAFDPVTQTEIGSALCEEFKAVMFPPSREGIFKAGTLEFKFEAEFYLAMKDRSFTPGPGDTIEWAGRVYTVQHSQAYDPAGDGPILTVAYGI